MRQNQRHGQQPVRQELPPQCFAQNHAYSLRHVYDRFKRGFD
jgi:hypothetical protein